MDSEGRSFQRNLRSQINRLSTVKSQSNLPSDGKPKRWSMNSSSMENSFVRSNNGGGGGGLNKPIMIPEIRRNNKIETDILSSNNESDFKKSNEKKLSASSCSTIDSSKLSSSNNDIENRNPVKKISSISSASSSQLSSSDSPMKKISRPEDEFLNSRIKNKTPILKDSPLLKKSVNLNNNNVENNSQVQKVRNFNRNLRKAKSFRSSHRTKSVSYYNNDETTTQLQTDQNEITFRIAAKKFGRSGWKIMPVEDSLNIHKLINKEVMDTLMAKIQDLHFSGKSIPATMTIKLKNK